MKQLVFNQIRWAMKNIKMYFLSVWCPFHSLKGQSWGLFLKKKTLIWVLNDQKYRKKLTFFMRERETHVLPYQTGVFIN